MISPEREYRKGLIETITGSATFIGGLAVGAVALVREGVNYLEAGLISGASLRGEPVFQLDSGSKAQIVVGAALTVAGLAVAQHGERRLVHVELLDMAEGQ